MKKFLVFVLVAMFLLCLTGCDEDDILHGDLMGSYANQIEESKEQFEQGMEGFAKIQDETQRLLDKANGT